MNSLDETQIGNSDNTVYLTGGASDHNTIFLTAGMGGSSGLGGTLWLTAGTGGSCTSDTFNSSGNWTSGDSFNRTEMTRGGDITFMPGQGRDGVPGGSVIWCAASGDELMRLSEDGISLFGQQIPIEKVLRLLSKLNEKECSCSTAQLMLAGCKCGGS